jgi:hypothetical protein
VSAWRWAAGLLLAGAAAHLLLGALWPPPTVDDPVRRLARFDAAEASRPGMSGFRRDDVYPSTLRVNAPPGVRRWGSWHGKDAWTGRAESPWYVADGPFLLLVAGYPDHAGNSLRVEARDATGRDLPMPPLVKDNPAERWIEVRVRPPRRAARLRVVAEDGSVDLGGWVGVSEPYRARRDAVWLQCARVLLAGAAAFTLLWGPGLAWRALRWRSAAGRPHVAWTWLPGLLVLASVGLVSWAAAAYVSAAAVCRVLLAPVLLLCVAALVRGSTVVDRDEGRLLLVSAVACAIALARAGYSQGPVGELAAGTIARTLEVGPYSDSVLPYHVVQLIAYGDPPDGPLSAAYFAPYSFRSRGPLAGIAVAPVVLGAGAVLPRRGLDDRWRVFDAQGFAAYRAAMIVLASPFFVSLGAVGGAVVGVALAPLTILLAAATPFFLHETYFTWPKLHAAACALLAVLALRGGRAAAAGLLVALGYLFHASALFALPTLLLLAACRRAPERRPAALRRAAALLLASAVALVAARLLLRPEEAVFVRYALEAGGRPARSVGEWLACRRDTLLDTLVPFRLFVAHRNYSRLLPTSGASPAVVPLFLQCAFTLPLGVGLAFFVWLLRWLAAAAHAAPRVAFAVVILPFAVFWLWWGSSSTGLLREGLHFWVAGMIVLALWRRLQPGQPAFTNLERFAILLRPLECAAMMLVPTWATTGVLGWSFRATDLLMVGAMLAGLGWLAWATNRELTSVGTSARSAKLSRETVLS